jgi:hypothetical protein
MKSPLEVFNYLLARIMLTDRWRGKGPGAVVEHASAEERAALKELKSSDIEPGKLRIESYWMMGSDWEDKRKVLEFEKKCGIQPPPRKKYGDYND